MSVVPQHPVYLSIPRHDLANPCQPHILQDFDGAVAVRIARLCAAELIAGVLAFQTSSNDVSNIFDMYCLLTSSLSAFRSDVI